MVKTYLIYDINWDGSTISVRHDDATGVPPPGDLGQFNQPPDAVTLTDMLVAVADGFQAISVGENVLVKYLGKYYDDVGEINCGQVTQYNTQLQPYDKNYDGFLSSGEQAQVEIDYFNNKVSKEVATAGKTAYLLSCNIGTPPHPQTDTKIIIGAVAVIALGIVILKRRRR